MLIVLVLKVFFYDKNAAIHVKVVAVLNGGNVVVKEYDVVNKCVTVSDIIFNKEIAEKLINEECS